jgi:hypothetical protein
MEEPTFEYEEVQNGKDIFYEKELENLWEKTLERLEQIRNEEFEIHGYVPLEFVKKEKVHKEMKMEMIEHQKTMRKQVLMNRNRSAKNEHYESQTVFDEEKDILNDDLFVKVEVENQMVKAKKEKIKLEDISKEELNAKIRNYIERKKYVWNQEYEKKWMKIWEREDIDWKKQITFSSENGEIVKIKCIQKTEYGEMKIEIEEEKSITKEERTAQEKRKKILKRFA